MGSIKRYLQFVKPYKKQIALTISVGILKFSIPLGLTTKSILAGGTSRKAIVE